MNFPRHHSTTETPSATHPSALKRLSHVIGITLLSLISGADKSQEDAANSPEHHPSVATAPAQDSHAPNAGPRPVPTPEQVAEELALRHVEYVGLSAAAADCIDGRTTHCVAGLPGGTVGQVIGECIVVHQETGAYPTQAQIKQFMEDLPEVHFHTGEHKEDSLWKAISNNPRLQPFLQAKGMERLMKEGTEDALLNEELIKLAVEHNDCGFLAALLKDPESFHVTRDVGMNVIRAGYELLWEGAPVTREILKGNHNESFVLFVGSSAASMESSQLVPEVQPANTDQTFEYFVYTEGFAEAQAKNHALMWSEIVGQDLDPSAFAEKTASTVLNHTVEIASRLAPGKPILKAHLDPMHPNAPIHVSAAGTVPVNKHTKETPAQQGAH